MVYKYVSTGLSPSGKQGIVSYFHNHCAVSFNLTVGPEAKQTDELPPKGTKCKWCGKQIATIKGLDTAAQASVCAFSLSPRESILECAAPRHPEQPLRR